MIPLPPLTDEVVAFMVCAPIIVPLTIGIIVVREPVHSTLCMARVMVRLAVLCAAQNASFLLMVQIIVYTGAILTLFLFVVMLIGIDSHDSAVETLKSQRATGVLTMLGPAGLLMFAARQVVFTDGPVGPTRANGAQGDNAQGVAALLFPRYIALLETTSALLIAVVVGAMVLARGNRLHKPGHQAKHVEAHIGRYAVGGMHSGPDPNSGVYVRSNATHIPALFPDDTVTEKSVNHTLTAHGVVMTVSGLRNPTTAIFGKIEKAATKLEGKAR